MNNMVKQVNFPMMLFNFVPNIPNTIINPNQGQKIEDINEQNKNNFHMMFPQNNPEDKNEQNKNNFNMMFSQQNQNNNIPLNFKPVIQNMENNPNINTINNQFMNNNHFNRQINNKK
jgi:hypothetical protein